jgi:DNA-binding transcriptional LysR family regulator
VPFDRGILFGVSVLAAVVDGGNFVKAAELIVLTDSGVSRTVTKELRWPSASQGVPILRRTSAEMSRDA